MRRSRVNLSRAEASSTESAEAGAAFSKPTEKEMRPVERQKVLNSRLLPALSVTLNFMS